MMRQIIFRSIVGELDRDKSMTPRWNDITIQLSTGDNILLSKEKKPTLICNVASACGLTSSQFSGLKKLAEQFPNLRIILVPCNQFLMQNREPLCSTRPHKRFIYSKEMMVNGDNQDPLYRYLKSFKKGRWMNGMVKKLRWNYEKFLLNRDGEVVVRIGPHQPPSALNNYIESLPS